MLAVLFKVKNKLKKGIEYLLFKNVLDISGQYIKSNNSKITHSKITVLKEAKLIIEDGVEINNYNIIIAKGELRIGSNTKLSNGSQNENPTLYISDGIIDISNNCYIKADFSIRFGGQCKIGSYTGIMERTEIRCDELIEIGEYNMISYECMIYDTNTHCIYPKDTRRALTKNDFPIIGREYEKPITKAVKIGNDCWIGKRATILKGVTIGNESIVASMAVVTKNVGEKMICYGNPAVSKTR